MIHASYGLAAVMSGLFLNLYLWRIAQDLTVNALFILLTFIFGAVAFWLGGIISKQKDRKISYQLGIGLTAVFYLLVIILQETVASIPMLIGVLNGLAAGFYWLGFLILLYDLVDVEARSAFLGKQMAVFGVVNTIGPALSGGIIKYFDLFGYNIIFTVSFVLFVLGVILSIWLPKDQGSKRKLKTALLWRLTNRTPIFKKMWLGWVVFGSVEGLIIFLPPLLLFMAVENEFYVSIAIIFLGIIAIFSSLWHTKYNHKEREPYTVLYVWIFYTISCIPLLVSVNLWTILIFLIVNEISKALLGVTYFSFMFRLIGTLPKKAGLRIESLVVREVTINIGRVMSVIALISLYNFNPETIYFLLFGVILIQGYLYKIMITKTENKVEKVEVAAN